MAVSQYYLGMYRLRTAGLDDLPRIRRLIAASVRGLHPKHHSPAQVEASLRTIFTVDTRLLTDGTYFVAEAPSGDLAACGGWSRRKTLYGGDQQVEQVEPELLDPAVDAAKIRAIFVHPDHARKKLGTLILKTAEEAAEAEGYRAFEMGSTLAGVALYTLRGYSETGRRQVPVDGDIYIEIVLMRKPAGAGEEPGVY